MNSLSISLLIRYIRDRLFLGAYAMSQSFSSRIPLLILLAALLALLAYLNWPQAEVSKQKHQRIISVTTVNAEKTAFRDVIDALGNVRANEQVQITSQSSDIVERVSFDDGQVVEKGQLLVQLNNVEEVAKVKELEANLAESVSQLNRFQGLLDKKATSKSQVEEQEAKTKAISAQLLSARAKVSERRITAPFNGVIGFKEISVGSFVESADVITTLDDIAIVKVDFSVPERFFTTIKIDQPIIARNSAYQKQTFMGKITSVDPRIDTDTRMVRVRAQIANEDFKLRPGMLLTIEVERNVEQVMQLPESAIIPIQKRHFVFVIEDSKALRKEVMVGRRKPGIVEITSGLALNEKVVIEGALKLRDGSQVAISE